ncbi:hypothetical protein [Streptococcus suis]|uniref:hypothetical protein n=1 Tax=Streptococcus suis TaxID=1307 RepID=UPI0037D37302
MTEKQATLLADIVKAKLDFVEEMDDLMGLNRSGKLSNKIFLFNLRTKRDLLSEKIEALKKSSGLTYLELIEIGH